MSADVGSQHQEAALPQVVVVRSFLRCAARRLASRARASLVRSISLTTPSAITSATSSLPVVGFSSNLANATNQSADHRHETETARRKDRWRRYG